MCPFMKFFVSHFPSEPAWLSHAASGPFAPKNFINATQKFRINGDKLLQCLPFCVVLICLRFILCRHSMGGLVAYQLILQNPKMFDGAVLSAPSNKKPAFVSDAMFTIGKAASFLFPWLRPQPLDISTLSRDPEIGTLTFRCFLPASICACFRLTRVFQFAVKAYNSDPLVWHSNIPLQLGSSIIVVRCSRLANIPPKTSLDHNKIAFINVFSRLK